MCGCVCVRVIEVACSSRRIAAVETSVSEVFLIQTVTHIHTKPAYKPS